MMGLRIDNTILSEKMFTRVKGFIFHEFNMEVLFPRESDEPKQCLYEVIDIIRYPTASLRNSRKEQLTSSDDITCTTRETRSQKLFMKKKTMRGILSTLWS